MNIHEERDREDLLASLICQYEQIICAPSDDGTFDDSALGTDAELAARFGSAKRGLEALDRVRRLWSPPGGESPEADAPETIALLDETSATSGKTIGRFLVQWELGRGGLGVVFLAHDPKLHREVALKVPRLEALVSSEVRQRFLREAAAAARLNHPNLVSVYEVGEDSGICYIAAEYCPGTTLRAWIAERSAPIPPRVAATIVRDLAASVQHAHSRGVLHRDIKPSNVLVSFAPADEVDEARNEDRAPIVKLADFGMAKLVENDGDQTRTGAILGTLAYMAPEQAEGRTAEIDTRTDVYGLGAVLYEVLTGRPPFQGETDADTLRQLILTEVTPPSRLRSDMARDLEAICLKCLAKDQRLRYQTSQELVDDLQRFLDHRATEARPLWFPETLWIWVRRRPWAAAMAALLLVSAGAILATAVVYNGRLRAEISRADLALQHAQQEADARRRLLYSADVRLAYESYQANNVVQAIEALDRQVPGPRESDLREFAWRYLRDRCEPENRLVAGHDGAVFSIVYSPDGRLLATAGQDGTVRLWNAATGSGLKEFRGHTTEVTSVEFAPDGRRLASGSEDRTVRIWDVDSGMQIRVLEGHRDHVQSVAFSPDGRWLASGSRDTTVRVWSVESGEIARILDDEMDIIRAVRFSPAGDMLFAVDEAEHLQVWGTEHWNRLARETVSRDKLFSLAVSRDGALVAAAGRRTEISIWRTELDKLTRLPTLERGHTEWIQSLAFNPVDDTLVSGGKDGVIRLWHPGEPLPRRTLLGHKDRIWSVACSPDGQQLASAGGNGAIRLWDLKQFRYRRYPPLPVQINCMALSADDRTLLTGSWDGAIQVWDPDKRALKRSIRAHSDKVADLRISPDGSLIASSDLNGELKLWSSSLKVVRELKVAAGTVPLAWAPDSKQFATVVDDGEVEILYVTPGSIGPRFEHDSSVREMLFTADGRYLVVTTLTSLVVWDLHSKRQVLILPEGHTSVAATRDGGAVAAIVGSSVSLIGVSQGFRHSRLVTLGNDAKSVAFSPDGNTLAVALMPPAIISLWDRRTHQELARIEHGARYVNTLAFFNDGRRLLLSGIDADDQGGIWEWEIRN